MELRQPNKTYHTDHSIMYSCQYHVIFCPKYRRKVLIDSVAPSALRYAPLQLK